MDLIPQSVSLEILHLMHGGGDGMTVSEMIEASRASGQENIGLQVSELFAEEREARRAERKRMRVERCGKPSPKIDMTTKSFRWYPFYCGDFRNCPRCHENRVSDLKRDIERALYHHPVHGGEISSQYASEIISQYDSKEEYRRFPLQNERVYLFSSEPFIGSERLDVYSFDKLPWDEIVNTPHGSRTSGSLGKQVSEPDENSVQVTVSHHLTNAPTQVELVLAREVERLVADRSERTADELQETSDMMSRQFEQLLAERGYEILLTNRSTQTVDLRRIKELNESRRDLKRLKDKLKRLKTDQSGTPKR